MEPIQRSDANRGRVERMFKSLNFRALGLTVSARTTIEVAATSGFGGVDLLVRDLVEAGDDPAELRARMDDLGLRGGAWPLPVDWRGDADRFARDLERLHGLASVAARLGLVRTGTWVMPETAERPETEDARVRHRAATVEMHVSRLGAIARVLADHGARLGLEVIGVESSRTGKGLPFVYRMADLDPVLGAVWREAANPGIVLDNWHLYAAAEGPEAALSRGIDRVVWVHVADLPAAACLDRTALRDDRRGLPGEHGAIDTAGLLRRLATLGYDGPVTAEPLAKNPRLQRLSPEAAALEVARAFDVVWPAPLPRPLS